MTEEPDMTVNTRPALARPRTIQPSSAHAFLGMMLRDFRVMRRELIPFIVRVLMQPLLFLFVFTYLFPRMGSGSGMHVGTGDFATVLLPGLMSVAIMFTGIAAVALPLSTEFGVTREIDDRVMCPLPVYAVALEKICFSALQSIFAALLVLPLAVYIPSTPVHIAVGSWTLLVAVLVLASFVSGALGLAIGASVKPRQIGLVFSIIVIPITFLGCVYYPWALLSHVRWLQIAILINPLVYMSEGLRAALEKGLPHMPILAILAGLVVSFVVLGAFGLRAFLGRVIS